MFESVQIETKKNGFDYLDEAKKFLGNGELFDLVGNEEVNKIIEEVKNLESNKIEGDGGIVQYDKYKKVFIVNNETVTPGEIVASSNFNHMINFPENYDTSFKAKRLKEAYLNNEVRETFTNKLNKVLATKLSEKAKLEDLFKSKAYIEIANREEGGNKNNEQLGVLAEKLMYSFAQMISIDKSNLNIKVEKANAYQDVQEKIDFTIKVHKKIRGVGTEVGEIKFEDKNYGIQFTINESKIQHKQDQINKSKSRENNMDDILLVTLDQNLLLKAKLDWQKDGKKIKGIFAYLPKETKIKTIENLFKNILSDEDIKNLVKNLE